MSEDKVKQEVAETEGAKDVESTAKKLPYPKSVFFILVNEFCERFSFYGMRAILTLYLKNVLKFDEDVATIIYHAFVMLSYFTPLFGAMIADSFLGKFRTIFYLSIVYACGNIVLSLAATPPLHIPGVPFSMIGLALIAVGTGGIKPCVSSFGGDQFILPQQERQLASFFSIFYLSINAGSTLSMFITPMIRKDVGCFGDETCYSLAFVIPAALMIISLVIFLIGRPMYRITNPSGNVVLQLIKTVKYALSQRSKRKSENKDHWMDYAEGKYTKREVEDIKIVLRVLFLFIPVPLYWSLYDQQGSRWTFQAARMDGDLGGFVLKPDQVQVINPILIMLLIPVFDRLVYPAFNKIGLLKKPLQKMVVGGTLVALAFVVSGILEIQLEKTYPVKLEGNGHLNVVNMAGLKFDAVLENAAAKHTEKFELNDGANKLIDKLPAGNYSATLVDLNNDETPPYTLNFDVPIDNAITVLITKDLQDETKLVATVPTPPEGEDVDKTDFYDMYDKEGEGKPYLRVIQYGVWLDPDTATAEEITENHRLRIGLEEVKKRKTYYTFAFNKTIVREDEEYYPDYRSTKTLDVDSNKYNIFVGTGEEGKGSIKLDEEIELRLGGSYILCVVATSDNRTEFAYHFSETVKPNSVKMLWIFPQYIVLSCGEIMFSITIMDFCYSQAPVSMKSVMQSAWLLTVAIGNLIDVIIAALKLFDSQWKEFFLFAGLMIGDLMIFAYMAYKYQPAQLHSNEEETPSIAIEDTDDEKKNPVFSGDSDDDKNR